MKLMIGQMEFQNAKIIKAEIKYLSPDELGKLKTCWMTLGNVTRKKPYSVEEATKLIIKYKVSGDIEKVEWSTKARSHTVPVLQCVKTSNGMIWIADGNHTACARWARTKTEGKHLTAACIIVYTLQEVKDIQAKNDKN